jgi:hypothetical protein
MFAKLETYSCSGTPREGFTYTKAGERYFNVNHIVAIADCSDGFSAITFHGGNAYVLSTYYIKMKADALVAHLLTVVKR